MSGEAPAFCGGVREGFLNEAASKLRLRGGKRGSGRVKSPRRALHQQDTCRAQGVQRRGDASEALRAQLGSSLSSKGSF